MGTEGSQKLASYQNIAVKHHLAIDETSSFFDDYNNNNSNNNRKKRSIFSFGSNKRSASTLISSPKKGTATPRSRSRSRLTSTAIVAFLRPLLTMSIFFIVMLYIYHAAFFSSSTSSAAGAGTVAGTGAGTGTGTGTGKVQVHHHDHTIPTLLSIRSDALDNHGMPTGDFVNSLDAVVYDLFQQALFNEDNSVPKENENVNTYTDSTDSANSTNSTSNESTTTTTTTNIFAIIGTDKHTISFHDNITVSWTFELNGEDHYNNYNSGNDVIALYCPASESDPQKFKDAATISQIEVTNKFNVRVKDNDDNIDNIDDGHEHEHEHKNYYLRRQKMGTNTNSNSNSNTKITHEWFIPSFPIIREETCEFRLWLRGHNDYHEDEMGKQVPRYNLGASSEAFNIVNALTVPTTIHLALTEEPTEMMVQFSTGAYGTPIVVYHQDKDLVTAIGGGLAGGLTGEHNDTVGLIQLQMQLGNSTTYKAEDMCQEPATLDEPGKFSSPGMLHSISMKDLIPDTTYYYKVGIFYNGNVNITIDSNRDIIGLNLDNVVWSDVNAFESPLPPPTLTSEESYPQQQPFSFIVYADQGVMGYGNNDGADRTALWANKEIEQNNIRSVHHIGDLSYAQGASHVWDEWLDMVSVFSARVPLMVGIGNHEYDHTAGGENGKDPSGVLTPGGFSPPWGDFAMDSNGECGVPTAKRFTMPRNGNGVFWYSFNSGNVKTIMLSSEHDLSPQSKQHKWLENELSSTNRTKTPWVLVESHRPMYNNEDIPANTRVGIAMRKEFEHLLYQYNVDLFISGHYHSYMRSCAGLYRGVCNNGGPTHITVGTAGAELDDVPLLKTQWAEKYIAQWGYGRITSFSNNTLLWEFVSDNGDRIKDSVMISK